MAVKLHEPKSKGGNADKKAVYELIVDAAVQTEDPDQLRMLRHQIVEIRNGDPSSVINHALTGRG